MSDFRVVGGLEQTGILTILAGFIGKVSGGNLKVMIAIIIWVSAVASAFIDNIPFAATMIPVIDSLAAAQGIDISILAWALAMGTDIGGSATPIGASANVVGIATAAKSGHMIKWGRYCKTMAPATIIVIFVSMFMICKIFIMPDWIAEAAQLVRNPRHETMEKRRGYHENTETGDHFHRTRVRKCGT